MFASRFLLPAARSEVLRRGRLDTHRRTLSKMDAARHPDRSGKREAGSGERIR